MKLPATYHSLNAYHLPALHLLLHFQPHDLGHFIPDRQREHQRTEDCDALPDVPELRKQEPG